MILAYLIELEDDGSGLNSDLLLYIYVRVLWNLNS